ncbi:hypothetical protein ACFQMA_02855 [Halosimplex aquaticum]|uniref:Uncharacterized protein n=1 Tax=Halosimplex aquaticum TaxID=3026162 RepID=A0ABD5XZE7_9EURY
MILFKVTDAPTTHEGLVEARYEVMYGRRLFMEDSETVITTDPTEVADRGYYTLAYAERGDHDDDPVTAAFITQQGNDETEQVYRFRTGYCRLNAVLLSSRDAK